MTQYTRNLLKNALRREIAKNSSCQNAPGSIAEASAWVLIPSFVSRFGCRNGFQQAPSTPASPQLSEATRPGRAPSAAGNAQGAIAWSSFFFALLQSICTFFAAFNGLRLVIGISSLAITAGVGAALDRFHADWIRIPMIGLALLGTLLNLAVLVQVRRLRNRPASRWRQVPLSPRKIQMERIQLVLSIATMSLIGIEEYLHRHMFHHL